MEQVAVAINKLDGKLDVLINSYFAIKKQNKNYNDRIYLLEKELALLQESLNEKCLKLSLGGESEKFIALLIEEISSELLKIVSNSNVLNNAFDYEVEV